MQDSTGVVCDSKMAKILYVNEEFHSAALVLQKGLRSRGLEVGDPLEASTGHGQDYLRNEPTDVTRLLSGPPVGVLVILGHGGWDGPTQQFGAKGGEVCETPQGWKMLNRNASKPEDGDRMPDAPGCRSVRWMAFTDQVSPWMDQTIDGTDATSCYHKAVLNPYGGVAWLQLVDRLRVFIRPNGLLINISCHSAGSNRYEPPHDGRSWSQAVAKEVGHIYAIGEKGRSNAIGQAAWFLKWAFEGGDAPQEMGAYGPGGVTLSWHGWPAWKGAKSADAAASSAQP